MYLYTLLTPSTHLCTNLKPTSYLGSVCKIGLLHTGYWTPLVGQQLVQAAFWQGAPCCP